MAKRTKQQEQQVEKVVVAEEKVEKVEDKKEETPVTPVKEEKLNPVTAPTTIEKKQENSNSSISSVTSILENGSLSNEEKLNAIVAANVPGIGFVKNLLTYQNEMSMNSVLPSEQSGADKNRSLFFKLMNVLDEEDFSIFKIKFDIVNLVFLTYKNDSFDEFKLHRFDLKWTGGQKQLKTYQRLVTVISSLCDKTKRAEQLKSISLSKMVDADNTTFSETNRRNILSYYQA